jgi:hypothetical protein
MNWNDVLDLAKNNPAPDTEVKKSDAEWKPSSPLSNTG